MSYPKVFHAFRMCALCAAVVSAFVAGEACAQMPSVLQSGSVAGAEIVASGTGEVSSVPAKAAFTIEIKALAATAAEAGAQNARLSRAVMDSLHAASIRPDEIAGTHVSVSANWDFDEPSRRQKRTAYQAVNSIEVQSQQLEKVAGYIDAALGAGGTGVTAVTYSAKDADAMRRQALSDAVMAARRDAEAMAQAGGGRLGELVLIQPNPLRIPWIMISPPGVNPAANARAESVADG